MTTAAITSQKGVTEEELMRLAGEDQQVEVVNGELVYNINAAYMDHGLFPGAPDLAVEVVSETETPEETRGKVHAYLKYGTEQVWVLYLHWGEVYVYTSADPKTIRIYSGDDVLTAETLFPGLEIVVNKFFELPTPPK